MPQRVTRAKNKTNHPTAAVARHKQALVQPGFYREAGGQEDGMKEVHEFHVDSARYLDDHGKPLSELPPQAGNTDRVLAAYRNMVLTRTFDSKAIALQRTGKCGTYPSVLRSEEHTSELQSRENLVCRLLL